MMQACWRRSSRSTNANCVEVARSAKAIGLRDSKDPTGPVLNLPTRSFATLLFQLTAAAISVTAARSRSADVEA